MFEAYVSAILCVLTRGGLNVIDRFYFKDRSNVFVNGLFFNAVYPFLIALIIGLWQSVSIKKIIELLFSPGIFLSALGAQLAASIFSYAFKSMSVRSVVFSAKFADLFIPLLLIPLTFRFDIRFYLFSCATSLIFLPVIYATKKAKESYNYKIIGSIIVILCAQAFINVFFNIAHISTTWIDFLAVFIAILFFRILIMMFMWIISLKKKFSFVSKETLTDHLTLALRSILACSSQGAFFYSITRLNGNDVWPILNISPLVATFFAAKFLKEKFGKLELLSTIGFFSLFTLYLLIKN